MHLQMEGRKMALVPFKLWEDMKRWKEAQIQNPRLPPDPTVSATASLQRDLSSVLATKIYPKAKNLDCMVRLYISFKWHIVKL